MNWKVINMLDNWIKRHLFECKDIGPEPELNKNPFWPEPDKETRARRIKELIIEHKNQQTE
uniref:Uncharacterized protein n=2 Tax=viral metagenome TaxID=1070528 RepID=A0A6M3KEK8_9ZZZZ